MCHIKQRQAEMKLIDIDTVKPFVYAAMYALNLATQAKAKNDERAMEIELQNAKQQLRALQERLERLEGVEP